jgi:hypothetical protein
LNWQLLELAKAEGLPTSALDQKNLASKLIDENQHID